MSQWNNQFDLSLGVEIPHFHIRKMNKMASRIKILLWKARNKFNMAENDQHVGYKRLFLYLKDFANQIQEANYYATSICKITVSFVVNKVEIFVALFDNSTH